MPRNSQLYYPFKDQSSKKGINCLRSFPVTGRVVWGARTLKGDDALSDDYKYIPVRRMALFLEESLYRQGCSSPSSSPTTSPSGPS